LCSITARGKAFYFQLTEGDAMKNDMAYSGTLPCGKLCVAQNLRVFNFLKWMLTKGINTSRDLSSSLGFIFFWYGVIPAGAPGMASADSFHSHPDAFEYTPFLDGFDCILRARGRVPAMRSQQWRYAQLIKSDRQDENFF
jgi:hypothetical protein